jgi:Domain of unknown function (DUF4214)/IPT/TIG domain
MFGIARLISLLGRIPLRLSHDLAVRHWIAACHRELRPATPGVEDLEGRIVPSLLGQQLFPSNYPWNQNIAGAPAAANSAAIIAHIGSSVTVHPDWGEDSASNGNAPLYGIPVNIVHGNKVAKVNVIIDNYPSESDILPVPIPANAVIEGDYQDGPNLNGPGYNSGQRGDSHLIVWDEDNNIAYELYGAARPSDPMTIAGGPTNAQWHAAQESVWNMKTDQFRSLGYTSADAAGLSILAGLARPDEGLPVSQGGQGAIDHALRFTLPAGDVNPQYIYPASHVVSDSMNSTSLPFGARLRLMNSPAVNSLISTMGPEAQIIARAMQQYGLILADIGSAMYVTGSSATEDANGNINQTWDMNDVLGLEQLTAGDFQVVDLTPVVTGLSTSTGLAGNTITITGRNFSGAAGRLSVLFGGAAAANVTYVSDSQITAVIPNGSGTVDVRVQSGINEVDPNNASDNVNNPIFGYGISATSAVDQFTYQTISATNSADSFATPTVVSGATDLFTIVVRNSAGNPVSGLPGSAFSLMLSGGTSAGLFSAVTETATKGTYTATYTGITAGSASAVTATVSGVTLTAMPIVAVVPAAASTFVLWGFGTQATAGVAVGFTVTARDRYGNLATGYGGTVHFASSDQAAGLPADYTFTGTDAGVHFFTVTFKSAGLQNITVTDTASASLSAAPADVTVLPDPFASARGLAICLSGSLSFAGNVATFTTVTGGESPSAFTAAINWGDGHSSAGTIMSAAGGGFMVTGSHAYQSSGSFTVTATVNSQSNTSTSITLQANIGSADQLFVRQLYHDLLARVADAGGLALWSGQLDQAAESRQQVATALVGSQEYLTDEIQNLYQTILGRPADPKGLQTWVNFLSQGGTAQQVEVQLLSSAEFFDRVGGTNAAFLAASYEDVLQRQVDANGASVFGQALANGMSRATVAQQLLESQESDTDIIGALYQQFLHRAADPSGVHSFLAVLQHGGTAQEITVALVSSQEYAVHCGGDADLSYVQQLYRDLLNRTADPSGLITFVTGLDSRQLTRARVVEDILDSNEYRGDVVQGLYQTYLHRPADQGSLTAFTKLVANGGTDEQVAAALAGSAEFFQDNGSTNTGFLDALYLDALGRTPDAAGLSTWQRALQGGATRAQVAAAILGSTEYLTHRTQGLYQQFLRRPADSSGLNAFVSALEEGAHDETVIAGLVESVEYFTRW